MNLFSSLAAAPKGVQTIIKKSMSSLDIGPFSVQVTQFDSMDNLDLMIAKEKRKTESALCAISGKTFGKEFILTALVPKKPVAMSVGIINVDQKVVERALVKDKTKIIFQRTKCIRQRKTSAFASRL